MGEASIIVYVVVGFVGLAAAALAFAAEATKIKVSDISVSRFQGCEYPTTPANVLGYVAALLVLIILVTICAVTRCACCNRNTSNTQSSGGAIVLFVISCIASIIGVVLLVSAANLSTRQEFLDSTGICYTVKPGIFATGGGLALVACILGLLSYTISTNHRPQPPPTAIPYQTGIAMGNPQFNAAPIYSDPKQQPQYAV